jgi:hypothetical protein
VTEIYSPGNATEARTIGADLDGDGDIDNKWGQIASVIPSDRPRHEIIREWIENGKFILLLRLFVDQFPDDDNLSVQLFAGDTDPTHDATEDNLSGNGHALIAPHMDESLHLCGRIRDGIVEAGPGAIVVPFPVLSPYAGKPIMLPLEAAWVVEGPVDELRFTDLMIGGGITKDTLDATFIPGLAHSLNLEILRDSSGVAWGFSRDAIDCACDNTLAGCGNRAHHRHRIAVQRTDGHGVEAGCGPGW